MRKAIKKEETKVTVTYPLTGTQRQVVSSIYEPIKDAIIKILKDKGPMSFTDLSENVSMIIKKKMPAFDKSIPWYTISVKRDLESRAIVETVIVKGKKLNRLKK